VGEIEGCVFVFVDCLVLYLSGLEVVIYFGGVVVVCGRGWGLFGSCVGGVWFGLVCFSVWLGGVFGL